MSEPTYTNLDNVEQTLRCYKAIMEFADDRLMQDAIDHLRWALKHLTEKVWIENL